MEISVDNFGKVILIKCISVSVVFYSGQSTLFSPLESLQTLFYTSIISLTKFVLPVATVTNPSLQQHDWSTQTRKSESKQNKICRPFDL